MSDTSELIFDPVSYINTPRWRKSHLGLERMVELLKRMGSPQSDLHFVHVAGTNGKGSVCAYVAAMLRCAGYCTGLFTSPYIETFEERIRCNGASITFDELTQATQAIRGYADEVEAVCGEHPTEFELMFAVALEYFRMRHCDIVVCEVGLGGSLDATNALDSPEVSVITRIGLDHTSLLGDTIAQIASEKAGIIKSGVPVVSWPQEPAAAEVIDREAAAHGCMKYEPDFSRLEIKPWRIPSAMVSPDEIVQHFRYRDIPYTTHLLGSYQPKNAAVALEVAHVLRDRGWTISDEAMSAGIERAWLPGRFEVIGLCPLTIVDGGHNPQGAYALAASLEDVVGSHAKGDIVFVMGVLADKDFKGMIQAVLPWARAFIACEPNNSRALDATVLAQAIENEIAHTSDGQCVELSPCVEVAATPYIAMDRAKEIAGEHGIIVAFGSLYAVAGIKDAAEQLFTCAC